MTITQNAGGTIFTAVDTEIYRLASLRVQLRLEARGMKSSGGAIRPRVAAEFALKPRDNHDKFISAITAKIEALRELGNA